MKILLVFFLLVHLPGFAQDSNKINVRKRIHQYKLNKYSKEDIQAEIDFGRKLAANVLGKFKLLKDKKITKYVNMVGAALVSYIGRPELNYYFAILDEEEVNAYACPGGYIFITKGALRLIKNEGQLAGVLAHEIAHVNQRHIVKSLKIKGDDTSLNATMANIMGGSGTGVLKFLNQGVEILFKSGLRKDDEFESDQVSIEIISSLGYDINTYYDFLENMSKNTKKSSTLGKTHPKMDLRLRRIKNLMKEQRLDQVKGILNKKRFNKYVKI